MLTDYNYLTLR